MVSRSWPFLALYTAALLIAASAHAATDADTREVSEYRLSQAGLDQYSVASYGLAEALAANPAPCDMEADVDSLDGMAARIDAIPGAAAAMEVAGMSSREYALFTMSLIQSGLGAWVVEQGGELPPEIATENVNFFQEHQMQLQELIEKAKTIRCESPEDYDEDDPAWEEDEDWEEDESWDQEDESDG